MNIAFWDNQLCERGTTTSLFDYAFYNEKLLKNKSFIFYEKNNVNNNATVIKKFEEKFKVFGVENFEQVDEILKMYSITHIYIIKSGEYDNRISKVAKNCIHCVFNCNYQHGDVYSVISKNVNGYNGQYPIVPHMINLPENNDNLRKQLGIPENAIVFGGYGGANQFDIMNVHKVVYFIANNYKNIYFLFANFYKFCPTSPNIIHLDCIIELDEKVKFINTCDAMLHARSDGETFGIAVGEFSSKNKPVITTRCGSLAHLEILGDKCILYITIQDLVDILTNFDPIKEKAKDWNAYTNYTPDKVMKIFNDTYLK